MSADQLQVWIRNDIRYFVNQRYDLGLAYAAARIAWKRFNDSEFNIAAHRAQWLAKARQIGEARASAIYTNKTGQGRIKSPYSIMPRRMWDLKSNRVIEFRMLHSDILAHEFLSTGVVEDLSTSKSCTVFWAITHSWTNTMDPVMTSINQYQWPTPLPRGLDLENGLRRELLGAGAEYVWLDVLCLRQQSESTRTDQTRLREREWKLDVPTIGNIYRKAAALVRYFNGLGQSFEAEGWDSPRHWLRRAWTLQEIRTENTTINGACNFGSGVNRPPLLMNTKGKVDGEVTTLRQALHPVVKLAAEVDSAAGCTVYGLVKQMAKRHSTQPMDKVAGLLYLLRTTELPTYDAGVSDEDAWARCFHVLPFARRIEILFDFPYRAIPATIETGSNRWFPAWRQLMEWPDRDPTYDHSVAVWPEKHDEPELASNNQLQPMGHGPLFLSNIWAISHTRIQAVDDEAKEYEIQALRLADSAPERTLSFYCRIMNNTQSRAWHQVKYIPLQPPTRISPTTGSYVN